MMALMFGMRLDFRNPAFAGVSHADRYAAALDMADWADSLGCLNITVSEHHGSPDGYLPSPLPLIAALAASTTNVNLMVAALIAPFYEPLRLAEDLVVLDHLSRGRVDLVVAGGYVRDEFEMYGVPMTERPRRVAEVITSLRAAFTRNPFEYRGRTVQVTPAPYRPGGPGLLLGGSSEAAARRAAKIADGFIPSVPAVWGFYRDEVQQLGRPDPGPSLMGQNRTIFLAKDPEQGWEEAGPYFLHEANAYGAWAAQNDGASPYRSFSGIDELRASESYAVVTPEEYVKELTAAPFAFASLHPMCGGIPPELAWTSLRLLENEVMPAFQ